MILHVRHRTSFVYDSPAYESHNQVRVAPADDPEQRCLAFTLKTVPEAAMIEYRDAFGNRVHDLSVHDPHDSLEIVADSIIERTPPPPPKGRDVSFAEFLGEDDARLQEYHEYLAPSRYVPHGPRLRRFFWQARPGTTEGVAEYVNRLVPFVHDQFEYEPGRTGVHSTAEDVLATGAGVCQDFAHLTIGLLRLAGIPARYVSGYLGPPEDLCAPREQASHAWLEALLPGTGWTGFDPTHRGPTRLEHVRIGVGRDYADVPPVRGVYRSHGQTQSMGVEVSIDALQVWRPGDGQQ
jgi:transglutaminase-like putative cysteine protease